MLSLLLNRPPTVKELIGSYRYQAAWGRASLQLNSNGTFVEEIHQADKTPRTVSGVWQARLRENYLDVGFQPFIDVNDTNHERLNENSGMPFFTPRSGKPYGVVDDDLGERFEQQ